MLLSDRVNKGKLKRYYPRDSETKERSQQCLDSHLGYQQEEEIGENLSKNLRTKNTSSKEDFRSRLLPTIPEEQEGTSKECFDFQEKMESTQHPDLQEMEKGRRKVSAGSRQVFRKLRAKAPGHERKDRSVFLVSPGHWVSLGYICRFLHDPAWDLLMGSLFGDWPSYNPHNFSQLRPSDPSHPLQLTPATYYATHNRTIPPAHQVISTEVNNILLRHFHQSSEEKV
ncbi:hypothetical protein L7F22_014294 [Adiantum nelumboides]|nr:hypothetical protein [Adiantum nelumboides]